MATASASSNISLSDITECSICLETWKDPRSLPGCDHTFCLKCLKTFVQKLDEDREYTRCPVCRKEFAIPKEGLDLLPKNFMHQQLLDARRVSEATVASLDPKPHEEIPVCDLCTFNIAASGYCVECDQNICTTCTMSHSRARASINHKVVGLEDKKKPHLIKKLRSSYCRQHHEEQVKLYCDDCQKALCTICHATEHVGHKCAAISNAAQRFVDRVKGCHVSVENRIAKTEGHLGHINKNRNEFLEMVSDKEKKLQKKEHEIINLIKSERAKLWNELKEITEKRLKEINMKEEEIKTELLALKGFMKTSKELLDNGSASDICQSTNDLLAQADVLVEPQTKPMLRCNLDKINIAFIPAGKPDVHGCEVRLVGLIHYTGIVDVDKANSSSQKAVTLDQLFTSLETQVKEKEDKISTLEKDVKEKYTKISSQEKNVKERDTKISSLEKDVKERDTKISSLEKDVKEKYTKISRQEKDVKERDTKISSLEKDVKERDTKISSLEKDVKEKYTKISSQEKDVKERDTKISSLEKDVKERDAKICSLEKQVKDKDNNISCLETQLKQAEEKYRKQNEAIDPGRSTLFLSKSTVVHVIPGADKDIVCGIAVLGSQLFIARSGETSVEVYDTNNKTTTPGLLKISDKILNGPLLAACSYYNCLYVRHWSSDTESVMYRVELSNSSVSRWGVGVEGVEEGVSWLRCVTITPAHTVLCTVYTPQRNSPQRNASQQVLDYLLWRNFTREEPQPNAPQRIPRVQEYRTTGELMREIRLDGSIDRPSHCIQLSDGNFVICHCGSRQHRVCIVDSSGRIIKSYGVSKGSGVDQLKYPCQLSVDKYDHVFVADCNNHRVQLLSPQLTLLGTVQTPGHQLDYPVSLHFDQINHRLYVNSDSDVLVVELSNAEN